MQLHTVDIDKEVTVKALDRVDPLLSKRLQAFGVRPGCTVCLKQKGLFSGACILECEGQRIGLRKKDLMSIEVE
ncbi:MAG: ferrous iron transport protein A [Bacillus sp. (in: firmicutes)]